MRDSQRKFIFGDGKKIDLYELDLKKKVATVYVNNNCGLVHNGFIYIGGPNGVSIYDEKDLKRVNTILKKDSSIHTTFDAYKLAKKDNLIIAVG